MAGKIQQNGQKTIVNNVELAVLQLSQKIAMAKFETDREYLMSEMNKKLELLDKLAFDRPQCEQ
ncbi:MAG: hypothetical protein LBB18_03355 [Puniceicoccales bacterium]|jgi:hypothetical protein|nr:hypothetical protein [Puniceicoccales bacterium]